MREVIRYKGKHSIFEIMPDLLSVPEAIIRDEGKTIVFDYIFDGKKLNVKAESDDGIYFEGTYESENSDRQKCSFTLYKNEKGCFLYGGYENAKDGSGMWLILLEICNSEKIE